MSELVKATNGDLVAPVVEGVRKAGREVAAYVRDHPDEVAVGVAPVTALVLATRRHRLNVAESILVTEVAYWCGLLLVREYRAWKARPAGPVPKLRRVV